MFKRALTILLLSVMLLLGVFTAAAQSEGPQPQDWIPADYVGYVRLRLANDTLIGLRVAGLIGSILQPGRLSSETFSSLDGLIPLTLLDVEDASFAADIAPWIGDEMIIAYQRLGENLAATPDDVLLIMPTEDILGAASRLSRIFDGQDLLQRETYRGSTLYRADKTTVALTPAAVIIGPFEAVQAALDRQAGEGERLVAQEAHAAVQSLLPSDVLVSAYFDGQVSLRALSMLLTGSETSTLLLQSLGEALADQRGAGTLEQAVLGNSIDGIGITLTSDTLTIGSLRAAVVLYDADKPEAAPVTEFNSTVLEMIPQNAMVVQSGPDAAGMFYDALYALPLTNFAGQVLAAFPVQTSAGAASERFDTPNTQHIQDAVQGALAVLREQSQFDLQDDLIQYFSGSYAFALIPRPNNPTPLNTPYDVLLIIEVSDGEAALEGLTQLAQTVLEIDAFENSTIEDYAFQAIPGQQPGEPALTMGLVDDLLVIATGSAVDTALDARRGDNQLISRPDWEAVSKDTVPHLYARIPAVYSTFLPQEGGQTVDLVNQLAAHAAYHGDGLFRVDILITLPGRFG